MSQQSQSDKDLDSSFQELLESSEPLSQRELMIAHKAADFAVKKMTENFYKDVGKTVVSKWLIIIGAAAVAFSAGKGWLSQLIR